VAANPPECLICQGGLGKTPGSGHGSGHTSDEPSTDLSSRQAHPPRSVPAHVRAAHVSRTLPQATHSGNGADGKGEEEETVKPVWKIKLGNKHAPQLFRYARSLPVTAIAVSSHTHAPAHWL